MQGNSRKPLPTAARPASSNANVTSAIGMEESAGRLRARRTSLFTQTVMWVTGLVCVAFLFGSLAQAWSNSQLMQQVQGEQKKLQQIQQQHDQLVQADKYYSDPAVIEKEAREQLGFIRPGEQPVVLVGSNQQAQSTTTSTSKPAASQGFWQDWWKLFFGE